MIFDYYVLYKVNVIMRIALRPQTFPVFLSKCFDGLTPKDCTTNN